MSGHTKKQIIKKGRPYEVKRSKEIPMSFDEAMYLLIGDTPRGAAMLRGIRARESLSQRAFGQMVGIAQNNISQMENGKRPIGKTVAQRIAKVFHTDYRLFL